MTREKSLKNNKKMSAKLTQVNIANKGGRKAKENDQQISQGQIADETVKDDIGTIDADHGSRVVVLLTVNGAVGRVTATSTTVITVDS